jgi:hypothetical protein
MNQAKRNSILALAAVAICVTTLSYAADLDCRHAWTTIGAAGVIDENDKDEVKLDLSAQYRPEAPAGSAILRYNISATDGLVGSMPKDGTMRLQVSLKDEGASERVRVFLRKNALGGSGGRTLMLLDSNTRPWGGKLRFGVRTFSKEKSGINFDFENNAYFLVVILNKYDSGDHGPEFVSASLTPVVIKAD